eukprot:GHVR01124729.1.p1 GENE.GHVR01124729.1~~GHVR01124729.1.p1  ORF type:complete len:312 (+),score=45.58 GHVR01124729.1:314-1249(+)
MSFFLQKSSVLKILFAKASCFIFLLSGFLKACTFVHNVGGAGVTENLTKQSQENGKLISETKGASVLNNEKNQDITEANKGHIVGDDSSFESASDSDDSYESVDTKKRPSTPDGTSGDEEPVGAALIEKLKNTGITLPNKYKKKRSFKEEVPETPKDKRVYKIVTSLLRKRDTRNTEIYRADLIAQSEVNKQLLTSIGELNKNISVIMSKLDVSDRERKIDDKASGGVSPCKSLPAQSDAEYSIYKETDNKNQNQIPPPTSARPPQVHTSVVFDENKNVMRHCINSQQLIADDEKGCEAVRKILKHDKRPA